MHFDPTNADQITDLFERIWPEAYELEFPLPLASLTTLFKSYCNANVDFISPHFDAIIHSNERRTAVRERRRGGLTSSIVVYSKGITPNLDLLKNDFRDYVETGSRWPGLKLTRHEEKEKQARRERAYETFDDKSGDNP